MVISGKKLSEVQSKIENLTGTERIYLSDGTNSPKYIETGQLATKDQLEQKANKDDIPQVDNLVTEQELESKGYLTEHQDISGLATKEELSGKQDTLKSGENVKAINGQSILGEGNIEIQGGSGGGISDAPSDGKKYVRSNRKWIEETTIDTSSFATKEELNDKISKEEANQAYQPKGDYLTAVPDEYVTEDELTAKGYVTETDLEAKSYVTTESLNSAIGDINTILDSINGEVI